MSKDSFLKEMAYQDYGVGQTYSVDDFNYFKKVCKEEGWDVTEEDFNKYFEYLDKARADMKVGEEMYGFEAISRTGLEDLTQALASSIKTVGSVGVIQFLLSEDFGTDFNDQITFIKNTTDLSDSKMVIDEILKAAETLLDDVQIEVLVNDMGSPEGIPDDEVETGENEFDEYQEPEDWSTVDQPAEEPVEEPVEGEELVEEETELEEENI
jgi:hypothetical protein